MTSLFFSYSHKDEDLRDELETHLAVLKRQGVIQTWRDRRITAGDEFGSEIDSHLLAADLILLLFSPDFLASAYCYEIEATTALRRHKVGDAKVIPVILRHCEWRQTPFADLQAVPKNAKPIRQWTDRDEAFLDVTEKIREAVGKREKHPAPASGEPAQPAISGPRSSNLRLAKTFTERDRDRFVDSVFEFMVRFFENSLQELAARNPGIEGGFKRIDANSFEATLYQTGQRRAACGIWRGGRHFGGDIMYSSAGVSSNSYNESLSVDHDEQSLFMKAMGMPHMIGMGDIRSPKLTDEGAAEYFWSLFVRPLQPS